MIQLQNTMPPASHQTHSAHGLSDRLVLPATLSRYLTEGVLHITPWKSTSTYHRSRLPLLITHPSNPLIGAASTLLSLLSHAPLLCRTTAPQTLFQALAHEIQAFKANLADRYPDTFLRVASYWLCAALDELIVHPMKCHSKITLPSLCLL